MVFLFKKIFLVLSMAVKPVIYRPPGMPDPEVLKMIFLRTFPYFLAFQAFIYRPSVQSGLIPGYFHPILATLKLLKPSFVCCCRLCMD